MEKRLNDLVDKALSRRSFLAGAGTVAAGTLIAGCSNDTPAATTPPATTTPVAAISDVDILNFALNLEYLEAEFYLRAATGNGLSSADAGTGAGAVTGGSMVPDFTALQKQYVYEIAQNELDHVRFLRSALGPMAVPRPVIDLTFFAGLATAATIVTPTPFNPFSSAAFYLIGAFIFEDVGVTAYHGAAKLLTDKGNLTAAAKILAVEAYHAGSIRTQIVVADTATPSPGLVAVANKVSALRATLGGGNETTLSSTGIVAANATTSVAFGRTTDQVLHIVYGTGGGAGVSKGGFFPAGLNGKITATLA